MTDVEEKRRIFIEALRFNPKSLKQLHNSTLYDRKTGAVCALGLGCMEFGVNLNVFDSEEDVEDPYTELRRILEIDTNTITTIWKWNDTMNLTFGQIADRLEERWFPVVIGSGDLEEIR